MSHTVPKLATEYERPDHVTESDWYRLLSAERRRELLDVFDDRSGPLALDSLAAEIATRDDELDAPDAADDAVLTRVASSLHHVHLPKLHDAGVVEYDPDSRRIEP
ncbi:hypothetical protein [Halogeometricum sp. CBA1124]|uniref:DUF7344 domain-containing protein n=1 Tax=Halogeometricum sp. CBA1124 TaxID=2668071 RepID=UPI00142B60B6|nr:hypothetical protein [Halogeometricum sp. CBA1124]MUV56291.1 hypothetical protein [Halogeometricum sp. CBA1124]